MVKPVDRIILTSYAGASIITFHPEASEHVDRTLQLIKRMAVKRAGVQPGHAAELHGLRYG